MVLTSGAWFAKVMVGPAIRLLIATARHLGIPIVTRDAKIVAYAEQGHVQAVLC